MAAHFGQPFFFGSQGKFGYDKRSLFPLNYKICLLFASCLSATYYGPFPVCCLSSPYFISGDHFYHLIF